MKAMPDALAGEGAGPSRDGKTIQSENARPDSAITASHHRRQRLGMAALHDHAAMRQHLPSASTATEQAPSAVSTARIFIAAPEAGAPQTIWQASSKESLRFAGLETRFGIAIAEIAQEIRFDRGVPGKNSRSTPSLSKPDIGPQSRPSGTGGDDEIAALQRAVAKGG